MSTLLAHLKSGAVVTHDFRDKDERIAALEQALAEERASHQRTRQELARALDALALNEEGMERVREQLILAGDAVAKVQHQFDDERYVSNWLAECIGRYETLQRESDNALVAERKHCADLKAKMAEIRSWWEAVRPCIVGDGIVGEALVEKGNALISGTTISVLQ